MGYKIRLEQHSQFTQSQWTQDRSMEIIQSEDHRKKILTNINRLQGLWDKNKNSEIQVSDTPEGGKVRGKKKTKKTSSEELMGKILPLYLVKDLNIQIQQVHQQRVRRT